MYRHKDYMRRIRRFIDDYEEQIVFNLDQEYLRKTTTPDKLADKIASFGGSWKFILSFGILLGSWMLWNTFSFTTHFDEKPFILLNLILSFTAAFQAPIIMMSQNRHASREKSEQIVNFAINYKAELEIEDLRNRLQRIETALEKIANLPGQ